MAHRLCPGTALPAEPVSGAHGTAALCAHACAAGGWRVLRVRVLLQSLTQLGSWIRYCRSTCDRQHALRPSPEHFLHPLAGVIGDRSRKRQLPRLFVEALHIRHPTALNGIQRSQHFIHVRSAVHGSVSFSFSGYAGCGGTRRGQDGENPGSGVFSWVRLRMWHTLSDTAEGCKDLTPDFNSGVDGAGRNCEHFNPVNRQSGTLSESNTLIRSARGRRVRAISRS